MNVLRASAKKKKNYTEYTYPFNKRCSACLLRELCLLTSLQKENYSSILTEVQMIKHYKPTKMTFFLVLGHDFFICWITLHFQEFQSAAIRKKIKIKIELKPKI